MTKRKQSSRTSARSTSRKSSKSNSQNRVGLAGLALVILLLVLAYYFGFDLSELGIDLGGSPSVVRETTGGSGDWYDIYFTSATCPPAGERGGGIDEIIADDIRQAELQVDVAVFEFESDPIAEALIELRNRGVRVRVVTDSDNTDRPSVGHLRRNGIQVVEDQRSGFMHNKFVVIDSRYIWTGSMNFTPNDIYCNNNNMVRFDSVNLAANYTAEMDEMYEDRLFGPTSPQGTPNKELIINDVRLENYFAPERRVAPILVEYIAGAREEILFMAFSFTHNDIGDTMIARARAGVNVQGVFETTGSQTQFSMMPSMQAAGLPNLQVRQDGNPRTMHHKVIIIDRQTVVFGSFNFTASANERNDENVVVVHDPTFASYFIEEFNTVWTEARQ